MPSYNNIEELWNDSDEALKKALVFGTPLTGNIKPPIIGPLGCDTGSTLTDRVNSLAAPQIVRDNSISPPQYLYRSIAADSLPCPTAINQVFANDSQGLADYVTATGNTLELKTIPFIYTTDQNLGAAFDPSAVVWPSFQDATCVVDRNVSGKSLHSNRGYQLGIIYLDEFGRATPALTSLENTVRTSCADSPRLNYAQISIPPTQLAPKWATHFRFVIKPTKENYETIYCSQIFANMVDGSYWFLLEGENVSKDIRSSDVTDNVSAVSALPVVRKKLVSIQRKIANNQDSVVEGRDIGTVVFPNADVKFFIVADTLVRAKRRQLDLKRLGEKKTVDSLIKEIRDRDNYDSQRKISPLTKAIDAIEVNTTNTTIDEQVNFMVNKVKLLIKEKK